jgi:predicted ATPase
VRIGLHTGTPRVSDGGYIGIDVHRAARIAAAGHGGQVVLSAATAAQVDRDALRDLGLHRFKDLVAPEHVYQLGNGEFPPLRSLFRTNLPVPATEFLGREAELQAVGRLLRRGDVRLVTLMGPGGTGKTRLALQAAVQATDEFPDGIVWVGLAPLRDPALIPSAVAQALEIREEPGRSLIDVLAERLAGARRLLVLDNAEHLLPGIASIVTRLRDCGGPTLILTSRERLNLQGEHVWAVPPLGEPDAVALFTARARAVDASFAPSLAASELCKRLDNLPLAIELAAARTAVFTPEQLLARLGQRLLLLKGARDADPRHQTLRATIGWSHDLLDQAERRLFRRFSVFADGCSFEGAQVVCEAEPDGLQSLLDKSLVRRRDVEGGSRYWMLETIRDFARERLEEADESPGIGLRHAHYYATVADAGDLATSALEGSTWLEDAQRELDNVRAAIDYARAGGRDELSLRLVAGMWPYWYWRGSTTEGRDLLSTTLASSTARPSAAEAKALWGLAALAALQGDLETAGAAAGRLQLQAQERGDQTSVALALNMFGYVTAMDGNVMKAEKCFEEALRIARTVEDGYLIQVVASNLGDIALQQDQPNRAGTFFEESLRFARARRDLGASALVLLNLGLLRLRLDDLSGARQAYHDGLAIARDLALRDLVDLALEGIAAATAADGDPGLAARLLGVVVKRRQESGAILEPNEMAARQKAEEILRRRLGDLSFCAALDDGAVIPLDLAVEHALQAVTPCSET